MCDLPSGSVSKVDLVEFNFVVSVYWAEQQWYTSGLVSHMQTVMLCGSTAVLLDRRHGKRWKCVKIDIEVSELVVRLCGFLPRDAMHKRGLCRHAVSMCLYVCVCHVRALCQHEYLQFFYRPVAIATPF